MRRILIPLLLAAAASACERATEPVAPEFESTSASYSMSQMQVSQDPTPDQAAVAAVVPGFGGYYLASGLPTVNLTEPSQRPAAEQALATFLSSRGFSASDLRVNQVQYSYQTLDAWYRQAWPVALAVSGAVFSDLDERANRLRFGAANLTAVLNIRSALAPLGIPTNAVSVQVASPIEQLASLRDEIRPVKGGLQINFLDMGGVRTLSYLCTLGFNAIAGGANSFITNSHCTHVQGGVETPTDYYQPLMDPDGDRIVNPELYIGTEVDDPHYWTGLGCAIPGFFCRYSDSSRAEYAPGVSSQLGHIARPEKFNANRVYADDDPSLLVIDDRKPTFRLVAKQSHSVMGEQAHKVGRTSGWTSGEVTGTCINSVVLGTLPPIIQLCQTRVDGYADSGDSGSPTFRPTNLNNGRSTLLGILWGGAVDRSSFVFSPMWGIDRELGDLQVF
jgi:hypothetical protein